MSSNTDLRETPQDFFDKLDKKYKFSLDVCATKENKKCNNYFNKEIDGLSQSRTPNCWKRMNPPYWREIWKRIKKASEERMTVCLVPARTDTKWFHDYIYNKDDVEIEFIKWRLKFGWSKNSAPFPSMIVIFKPIHDPFIHNPYNTKWND